MFCCGFLGTILVLISGLASIALLLAANVGTVGSNMAKSSIFLMELNLVDVKVSEIISDASGTATELGFADAYMFGMYGWCRGTQGDDETSTDEGLWVDIDFTSSSCSNSSIDYQFDPVTFVIDQVNEYNTLGLTINKNDITLPGGLNDYVKIAQHLSQVIYICSIIAIAAGLIAMILELVCWCFGSAILVSFCQTISFVAAVISSGCATGAYKYIESEFNKYSSTFGISAQLSTNYLVLTWLGTALSLVTIFLISFSRCCLSIGPSTSPVERIL